MHRSFVYSFVRSFVRQFICSSIDCLRPHFCYHFQMIRLKCMWLFQPNENWAHFVLINNNKETNTSIAIETKHTFPNNILNGLGVVLVMSGDLCLIHFGLKIWLERSGQLIDEVTPFHRYFYAKKLYILGWQTKLLNKIENAWATSVSEPNA